MSTALAEASSRSVTGAPDAVLAGRGITKAYPGGDVDVHALRGIDLELHEVPRRSPRELHG